jgi:hypothetical protein
MVPEDLPVLSERGLHATNRLAAMTLTIFYDVSRCFSIVPLRLSISSTDLSPTRPRFVVLQ